MRRSIVITKAVTPAAVDNGAPELDGVSAALSAGSVGVSGAAWNLPATISVQQDGVVGLRQYALNAGAHTISVSGLPTGVTYNAGLEQLEGASTGTASATVTFTLTLGAITVVDTATVSLTDPSLIVPALTVEYVDTSGVRQTTPVVDGVTTITGTAPFLVQFDASGTRAPAAYASQSAITDSTWGSSEEAYAFLMVGYRMHYGESLGGVWQYPEGSSYSRDEDTGPPLFGRVYTQVGTHQARLRVRDTFGNERTISCNVVVTAPATTVHIPVSQGSWPSWANNTRYTLDAGGDYRSFGQIETGGLHNIIIEKVGSGADPRVSSFSPDGRSKWSATSLFEYRAAHIRVVGIDFDQFSEGQRGFDYVGVIGGRMRRYIFGGHDFLWHEGSDINRSNVRFSRGLFLEETQANNINAGNGYIMFCTLRGFHARGTRFVGVENGSTTWLMLRVYGSYHSYRNNQWFLEINGGGSNGTTISPLALNGLVETSWRDDDTVGPIDNSNNGSRYGYIGEKMVAQHNQHYAAGSFITNGVVSTGGNPSGDTRVRPRLVGWEDDVWYPNGAVSLSVQPQLGGNYIFWRNSRNNMGSGSYITPSTYPPNNIQGVTDTVTYHGPYFLETTNSRPVPTVF